jgi:LuxR family maltose regulon positive regulatory protein
VSFNLLVTKLSPPLAPPNLVLRSRLLHKLNEGLQPNRKLLLVSAPAGYGKTTLVTEWLRSLQIKSTWLTLDAADNDPVRFLAYIIAALQQVDGSIGITTQAMLRSPQPLPPEVILTPLINEIASVPNRFILTLDDYHVVKALPIHQQLDFLLEHQSTQMTLVVITREDPPLPLARLRARGQMVEIRQDELRFSTQECSEFLQRIMGLNLRLDDMVALERRTEGWIAGLQLAALSMQGCVDLPGFIEAFSGSSHYILDYLITEVFERQPAEEQEFLLKTSILERLSGALCDAVTGRTGGRGLLERLEHANLFITPLDHSRTWYRYHHLFAELLRQHLQSAETISESELHRRASRWFAIEGFLPEAINHALVASDWEAASNLICALSETMLRRGELMTLLGWFKSLPDAVVRAHPHLCRLYGWVLILTGQLDSTGPYLDLAEQALQGEDAQLGQVLVAQAYLARARGQYPQSIALASQAMVLIHESDVLHRSLVTFTLGLAYFRNGNLAEAEGALLEACHVARLSDNDYARLTALGFLGGIQMMQGKLHRAVEYSRQALQEAKGSPTAAQALVLLGAILYEWNDLGAAADHLIQGLKASQYVGNGMIQADAYRALARLKQVQGDKAAALDMLRDLRLLVDESDTPLLHGDAAACHVEIALAQGDIASAVHWAEQLTAGIDPGALGPMYGLTKARLLLGQGQPAIAAEVLANIYNRVSRTGFRSGMIQVRVLQALAASIPADALLFLEDALQRARPEGFVRTFVDHGKPMKALLERLRAQGGELKPYILTLLSAFDDMSPVTVPQLLIEPLSDREIETLRLLDAGLSNQEIAARLVIGVGTVKSHVHNIIEKLGVSNRMQAVAKAREMGLV